MTDAWSRERVRRAAELDNVSKKIIREVADHGYPAGKIDSRHESLYDALKDDDEVPEGSPPVDEIGKGGLSPNEKPPRPMVDTAVIDDLVRRSRRGH